MFNPATPSRFTKAVVASVLLGAGSLQAASLALFTNDAVNGTSSFADESGASNVTVSDIVFGAAPNGAPSSDGAYSTYTGTCLQFIASDFTTNASLSSSDADDRFVTFSIQADAGYLLSVDPSDVFSYTVGGNTIGNSYSATTYSLAYVSDQSDFSNILFDLGVNTAPGDTTSSADRFRAADYTLNPTSTGTYQTLYFAIEMSVDNNTSNGTKQAMVGEVGFDGSVVPVPEPSASLLVGLGGLALFRRRRR